MIKTWHRILLAILVLLSCAWTDPAIGHAVPGSAAASEPVVVYLHTSTVIEGSQFTLGQVASIYSSDPARSQAFGQLPLGSTPPRPTLLPARMIQERMAAAAGEVVVVGERVAILPSQAVSRERLWFHTALLAFVETLDTYKRGRIEIELLDSPLVLEHSEARFEDWEGRIQFETGRSPYSSGFRSTLSADLVPAGTMQVGYRILAPENKAFGRALEGSFRIWIHHYLPVARAAVDIPANQTLTEDRLSFSEEDVSLLQTAFVLQGQEVQDFKVLSSVRRGERIDAQRLQRNLAVRAGDRVTINFARPGLLISLPGRAFRSGSVGDIIDVQPLATTKRIQARISSKGEVLVESR